LNRQNQELLASLGLDRLPSTKPPSPKKPRIDRPLSKPRSKPFKDVEPTRRSGRIKALQEDVKADPEILDLPDDKDLFRRGGRRRGQADGPELPMGKRIEVPSVRYVDVASSSKGGRSKRKASELSEDEAEVEDDYEKVYEKPTRAADGTNRLSFPGRFKDVFEPNVTPEEMLRGGAFAGGYFK
jgi:hypothetical protein